VRKGSLARQLLVFWIVASCALLVLLGIVYRVVEGINADVEREHRFGQALQTIDDDIGRHARRLEEVGTGLALHPKLSANLSLFHSYQEEILKSPYLFDYPAQELAALLDEAARAAGADWILLSGEAAPLAAHVSGRKVYWSRRPEGVVSLASGSGDSTFVPAPELAAGLPNWQRHEGGAHLDPCPTQAGLAVEWETALWNEATQEIGHLSLGRCLGQAALDEWHVRIRLPVLLQVAGGKLAAGITAADPPSLPNALSTAPPEGSRWLGQPRPVTVGGSHAMAAPADMMTGGLAVFTLVERPADGGSGMSLLAAALVSFVLLTLVVMLLGAAFIRRRLSRPLEQLRAGVHALEEGRGMPIEVGHTGNELEELAAAFNSMAAHLRQFREEIVRHRDHLEEQVQLRTAELADAKAAAEVASEAKSAFLANMSHEIRTPLHAIVGMAELVRRSGATPEQKARLDRIDAASSHLVSVINDILDFSKIEAGKIALRESPVNVGAIVDNVRSMVSEAAQAKNLQLLTEVPPGLGRLVGDATRLRQALLNYAGNAVKFTENGSITLSASVVEEADDSVLIRFEVRDSGIGIAPEAVARLFSPFEQADSSTTRQHGGTGLGLAITKRIAELMGGSAGASSTPGVGSTFWFTARLKKAAGPEPLADSPSAESPEAVLKRDYGHLKVLIADDDLDNRYITQHLLAGVWPRVDLADDGVQAVELATRQEYDVILMDMRMPHMDGLEATRRIRALQTGKHPLIFALTANVFPEDRARCIDAGMTDLIPKASSAEAPFAIILESLLRSRTARSM